MKKKKSKFLTFCFSLLPGAGHMYIGFMKMGLSLMAAFFFVIFLSTWLDIGPLMFVLPLIWFYSFFDCMNKRYSTDEEFLLLEDNYLFSLDELVKIDKGIFKKHSLFAGILLVLLGGYLVWNNIMHSLLGFIPYEVYSAINDLTRVLPQIIIGVAIIAVGAKLIIGKKRECDMND
jgi:TM2 domain-containing membrane protein YozV